MNLKQGDVVTYPDTGLFYQVVRQVPEEDAIICKILHGKNPIPLKMFTEGLIKTSVH